MTLHWKLFTDATSEAKARRVYRHFTAALSPDARLQSIQSYHKGGYTLESRTEFPRGRWPEMVLLCLEQAQQVGRSWVITGNIRRELEAWTNNPTVAGITNIEVLIEK